MNGACRQVCSLLTAFAVLLVSVTCTSAGCLLRSGLPSPAVPSMPSSEPAAAPCCAAHALGHSKAADHRSGDDPRCPLCRTTVVIGKSIEQNSGWHALPALCPLWSAALGSVVPPTEFTPSRRPVLISLVPPVEPSTLLRLHCALQD